MSDIRTIEIDIAASGKDFAYGMSGLSIRNLISVRRVTLLFYALCGALLWRHTLFAKEFSENQLVWDLQWWNAWSLLLLIVAGVLIFSPGKRRPKIYWGLVCFAYWGVVAVHVYFDGTPYGFNSIWGDQMFRTTMILKFMTFTVPTDMYLQGLPAFYPPLYFWLLARWANLFSLEAYQMLKTGSALIYAIGPFVLYWLWRKLVSRIQAVIIAVGTFVVFHTHIHAIPHEFLSHIIFIPWFAHYVAGAHTRTDSRGRWLVGGVIGAASFMLYYYPFLIGALSVGFWTFFVLSSSTRRSRYGQQLLAAWKVILSAAIFSSPYWLPLAVSMVAFGANPGQNRSFHSGYANLQLPFLEVSLFSLLALLGLVYLVRGRHRPVCRSLLLYLGFVPAYLLLGNVVGNLDMPVLYLKANDIAGIALIACAGMAFGAVYKYAGRRRSWQTAFCFLLLGISTPFLNSYSQMVLQRPSQNARRETPPEEFVSISDNASKVGKVYLSNSTTLPVYIPAYFFIPVSELVAHPAGRFHQRAAFLRHLKYVESPFVFATALRHNIFDPVDYILPRWQGDRWQIRFSVSTYPDGFVSEQLQFPGSLLRENRYIERESDGLFYRVTSPAADEGQPMMDVAEGSLIDSLRTLSTSLSLIHNLTSTGQYLLLKSMPVDWVDWKAAQVEEADHELNDAAMLHRIHTLQRGDSALICFDFSVTRQLDKNYRIFFHVYEGSGDSFLNYDFAPPIPAKSWLIDSTVVCSRIITLPREDFRYHVGLFSSGERLGKGYWGSVKIR